jgi:hypothetical protein
MRTLEDDLVETLDRERLRFRYLQIVVASERGSVLIDADDANRLARLRDALHAGGVALGMLGIDDRGAVYAGPYPWLGELRGQVERILAGIADLCFEVRKDSPAWVN